MVGNYDLGWNATPALGPAGLIRQRLSDEGKSSPLGPGFLHGSIR